MKKKKLGRPVQVRLEDCGHGYKTAVVEKVFCEICDEPVKSLRDRDCCAVCGRAYGECCNSLSDTVCVECA